MYNKTINQIFLKKLIFISLLFIAFSSVAQQGLQMEFTEQDSAQMELQRQIEYRQLISGNAFGANLLDEEINIMVGLKQT